MMASSLGVKKAESFKMFHVYTGCTTLSSFIGHRKKKV